MKPGSVRERKRVSVSDREVREGISVRYYDEHGKEHEALVTAVWGQPDQTPAINVVYVTSDETKRDPYGKQIERETSVVFSDNQSAHGRYWTFD